MQRLERIRAALQQLSPWVDESAQSPTHHISRSALTDLTDCLGYLCFPECSLPASRTMPPYLEKGAVMEWALTFAADIMSNQIFAAFSLHGDPNAVTDVTEFKPVQTSQRSQLDWNAPPSGKLSLTSVGRSPATSSFPSLLRVPKEPYPTVDYDQYLARCKAKSEAIVTRFLTERLPHVRWLLHTDVEAILHNDVAATSPSEVVLCYPGIHCMLHQRVAHQLYLLGVPSNFTRMLTEMAHSLTGIDIHPTTSIGHHFFIDHGTGVVIGATAIIGNHVSVYQGVTLGAKSFPTDKRTGELIKNLPRHPILEDGVTVYANAVVLGRVTIGKGSTIGGNCWVVRDVPPFSSVVQKSVKFLQPHERMFLHSDGSGI